MLAPFNLQFYFSHVTPELVQKISEQTDDTFQKIQDSYVSGGLFGKFWWLRFQSLHSVYHVKKLITESKAASNIEITHIMSYISPEIWCQSFNVCWSYLVKTGPPLKLLYSINIKMRCLPFFLFPHFPKKHFWNQ